jgi:hypothetical protein
MLRAAACTLFCVTSGLGIQVAFGCTCLPKTVKQARNQADAVFLGTIRSVTFLEPQNPISDVTVEFKVTRIWKGAITKRFVMRSMVGAFCDGFYRTDLVVGKQLVVFANRVLDGPTSRYSTSICTFTGPPSRYGKTLEQLGEGRLPAK